MAVVDRDVEAARHRDEHLRRRLQRVTRAGGASGDVVEIEDALEVEVDVVAALDEREISTWVRDDRKLDEPAVIDARHAAISVRVRWRHGAGPCMWRGRGRPPNR